MTIWRRLRWEGALLNLELLAGGIFVVTGGAYYLECAMRTAVTIEFEQPQLGPVTTPVELAWYYRPAEVFLRQVIQARSQRGIWRA